MWQECGYWFWPRFWFISLLRHHHYQQWKQRTTFFWIPHIHSPNPGEDTSVRVCLQKHCWHPHAFLLVFILVSVTACLGRSVAPLSCQADSGKLYQTSHPQLNCLFFPCFFHLALSFSVSRCSVRIFRWMLIYDRVFPSNHILLYKISSLELANILFG